MKINRTVAKVFDTILYVAGRLPGISFISGLSRLIFQNIAEQKFLSGISKTSGLRQKSCYQITIQSLKEIFQVGGILWIAKKVHDLWLKQHPPKDKPNHDSSP